MEIIRTNFEDLYVLEYNSFTDSRGEFVKTIHEETFVKNNLNSDFLESFYSISKKNVIRGMHFQINEDSHDKLVYVIKGRILDVILDLRTNSNTFGQYFSIELSEQNRKGVYIGKGFAHGFLSLEDDSIVEYHTSTVQSKENERGVHWNSFGFNWNVENPIVSLRDADFEFFNLGLNYF